MKENENLARARQAAASTVGEGIAIGTATGALGNRSRLRSVDSVRGVRKILDVVFGGQGWLNTTVI